MATLAGFNVPLNAGGAAVASVGTTKPNAVLVSCLVLNIALHQFCINEFSEQCYAFSKGVRPFLRSVIYYLLTSLSCVIFVLVSFVLEPNPTGLEVSFESDTFNLLIVLGWVVYNEESRQTALEGFLVVRDCLFYGGTIGILAYASSLPSIPVWWWIVLFAVFLFYWILNCFNSFLQYRTMKLLNLLEDERVVSPELLLTQQPVKIDVNELEDIITDNQLQISEEIHKFGKLLERAVPNERERKLHANFASIVLAFKTAIEIKRGAEMKERAAIYNRFWVPKEEEYFGSGWVAEEAVKQQEDEEQQVLQQEPVEDKPQEEEQIEESSVAKVLKYVCYPVYLLSLPKGRLKYLCYVLALALLFVSILFAHLSICYFRRLSVNYQLVALGAAQFLALPKLLYFLQLPGHSDYDFCNMFLQEGIVKASLLVPIGFLLNAAFQQPVPDLTRVTRYLMTKGATVAGFLVVMCLKKMVARQENFKYLAGLYFLGFVGCILSWML